MPKINFEEWFLSKTNEFLTQIKDSNIESKEVDELKKSLETLNKEMKGLYTKDSTQYYPAITKEKRDTLLDLFQKAGTRAITVISKNKDALSEKAKKTLTAISSGAFNCSLTMLEYNPGKGMHSFPILAEADEERIYDIGDENINTVGGNVSSRIPFSYTDIDGTVHAGVFTRKIMFDPVNEFKAICDKIDEKYPERKPGTAFYEFYKNDINSQEKGSRNENDPREMEFFIKDYGSSSASSIYKKMMDLHTKKNLFPQMSEWPAKPDAQMKAAIEEWKTGLKGFDKKNGFYINNALMTDATRIDSRNTAMSRAAAVLGVSDLLAHAEPMKIRYKGQVLEGTFMEEGKGIDPGHPTSDSLHYSQDMMDGIGLKSIADLQVLDFICGNVDRHAGNMLYRFDTIDPNPADHKFFAVQGIDNDLCLGNYAPPDTKTSRCCMASIEAMGVISQSMADRILNMSSSSLLFEMNGLGLSNDQMRAVTYRYNMLKKEIKKGTEHYLDKLKTDRKFSNAVKKNPAHRDKGFLRVIPDKDFLCIAREDLAVGPEATAKSGNLFYIVEDFLAIQKSNMSKVNTKGLNMKSIEKDAGLFIPRNERRNILEMRQEMIDATSFRGTSDQFKAVDTALREYSEFTKQWGDSQLSFRGAAHRRELIENVRLAAVRYLCHKSADENMTVSTLTEAVEAVNAISHNGYETKRINLIKKIGEWAENKEASIDKFRRELSAGNKETLNKLNKREEFELEKMKAEAERIKEAAGQLNNIQGPGL